MAPRRATRRDIPNVQQPEPEPHNAALPRVKDHHPAQSSSPGEVFDEPDFDGDSDEAPGAPDPLSQIPTAQAAQAVAPDISASDSASSRSTTAHDINHFFFRGDKKQENSKTYCKLCLEDAQDHPNEKLPNHTYYSTTGNSPLRVHLENYHEMEYVDTCAKNGWPMMLPKRRQREIDAAKLGLVANQQTRPHLTFSHHEFLNHLVNFIVVDDQSLNVIECKEFRNLLLLLRDDLKDSDIPHRTKLRESIMKAFANYFKTLKGDFAKALGKISCTADIWSSENRTSYFAITAHWMAREGTNLNLRTTLLAFHRIYGMHDGDNLGNITFNLLGAAGITAQIGHWTLDNAANNETFMKALGDLLDTLNIKFSWEDNRIMCFPHIINICTQHMLKSFSSSGQESADTLDIINDFPEAPPVPEFQTYDEAWARDPIALGRNIVRALRASGQRRDEFQSCIDWGNKRQVFRNEHGIVVTIERHELLHDVRTRWDSVYHMLTRLLELRPAIDYFLAHGIFNHDLKKYGMTPQEWTVLEDFRVLLAIPHAVQQTMSGEGCPTLGETIPVFEMYMSQLEIVGNKEEKLRKWTQISLDWATKYYCRMDLTKAYIVAMFVNPSVRMAWIHKHWDTRYGEDAASKVKALMDEYRLRMASANPPRNTNAANTAPAKSTIDIVAERFGGELKGMALDYGSHARVRTVAEEFSSYIHYDILPPPGIEMSIKFWETHEHIYPTIFAMAMDYLPIQASSVPCERVFSSSSETDTKKRNRIGAELMEALQILKFGLKKERPNFMAKWVTPITQLEPPPKLAEDGKNSFLLQLIRVDTDKAAEKLIGILQEEAGHAETVV